MRAPQSLLPLIRDRPDPFVRQFGAEVLVEVVVVREEVFDEVIPRR